MREGDRTAKPSRREKRLRAANKFYKQVGFDLAEARGRDPEDPDAPLFSRLRGLTGRIIVSKAGKGEVIHREEVDIMSAIPGKDRSRGGK